MNSVVLIGRLTRDPELRYTPDQSAVATFTLAVDRPFSKEKAADFIRVVVFGKQAENCERFLSKGRQAAVSGRIQTGSYKDKNGETRYTTDVVADRVEFLDWGEKGTRNDGGMDAFSRPAPAAPAGGFDLPDGFQTLDDDDDIPF